MEYRKIIKFGNSSHVISLPHTWMEKNKLSKGDTIYFSENGGNELVLAPTFKEKIRDVLSHTINADGLDIHELTRRIVSCYIGGYDLITISGKPPLIDKYGDEIRKLVTNLTALDIIEQTKERIIVRDMLDSSQFSLDASIRRADIIIKSMIFDIMNSSCEYASFNKRDADINRITYLSLRMIKKQLRENGSSNQKSEPVRLLAAWELLNNMEHFADEIKRIGRCLCNSKVKNSRIRKEYLSCLALMVRGYETVMKSYFSKDPTIAYGVPAIKEKIIKVCNNLAIKNTDVHMGNALEKLKASSTYVRNIARVVYELG